MILLKNKEKNFLNFIFSIGFLVFLILGVKPVDAATLYFSPSSGNFSTGNIFSVSLLLNTQGEAVNNVETTINFPTSFMEVTSISKSGSILSLWVEEPNFSNSNGTISFNGGAPTPGFNGSSGRVLTVVFRVKKPGLGSLISTSAAVRANDGFGTDVLKGTAQASFTFIDEQAPVAPATEREIVSGTPKAPNISSLTHPDPDKWYTDKSATFAWSVPSDVDSAKLLFGQNPKSDPTVLYVPAINKKTIDDIEDGVWYFHAQLKNSNGWSPTTHFRFQIDTEKPTNFEILEVQRDDLTDPRVKFAFDADDETSGIDHYEIQIDGKDTITWKDDGSGIFETPPLSPGKHILVAKAVDKAGNFLTNSLEFIVEPLKSPIITDYLEEVEQGDTITIKGTTYPDSKITIWIQNNAKDPEVSTAQSDSNGNFTFVSERGLNSGPHKLWAMVTDQRGAISNPSNEITFVVKQPTFIKIGSFAIGVLSILVPLLALIILFIFIILYGWYRFRMMKTRLRKEIIQAEQALHRAFDLLKEAVYEEIRMLEKIKTKRKLSEKEEEVINQLKKDLDDAEMFIKKEIKDIENELK